MADSTYTMAEGTANTTTVPINSNSKNDSTSQQQQPQVAVGDDGGSSPPVVEQPTTSSIGAGGDPTTTKTTTTTTPATTVPVVTAKRKEELLKKARHERRLWIERVALPYAVAVGEDEDDDDNNGNGGSFAKVPSALRQLQTSTLICRRGRPIGGGGAAAASYIPSATTVLSELYGLGETVVETTEGVGHDVATRDEMVGSRVEKLTQPFWDQEEEKRKAKNGGDEGDSSLSLLLTSPAPSALLLLGDDGSTTSSSSNDPVVMAAYRDLLGRLLLPESALMVQGMRNFCLQWTGRWKTAAEVSSAASALNAYTQSTVDALLQQRKLQQSSTLKGQSTVPSGGGGKTKAEVDSNQKEEENDILSSLSVRRSLESFMYAHVYKHIIDTLLMGSGQNENNNKNDASSPSWSMTQASFDDKLLKLQFVQPSHLEIACLADDDGNGGSDGTSSSKSKLESLLAKSIEALLSVDAYYSPYEKLQRILAVYKNVNASLSAALNDQSSSGGTTKLPSADDVLPTIILACLKARPANLLRNLRFVEVFAPAAYLRGEAGYAYTNLYGAVQFLMDLKMEDAFSSGLSISPEALKQGLEQSRGAADAKRGSMRFSAADEAARSRQVKMSAAMVRSDAGVPPAVVPDGPSLVSVQDVRAARLNGEKLDVHWALRRWQQRGQPQVTPSESLSESLHLPDGFTRSYAFLSADPQDIRVSDLPHLLNEYRVLSHVTEDLLSQRAARLAHEKKQRDLDRQAALAEEQLFLGLSTS